MQRILSTFIFKNQPLTPVLVAKIAQAKISSVEIFCESFHFNYAAPQSVRELGASFGENGLQLHALHAPTERDSAGGRGSGFPISIADPERIRRLDAVDEMRRALEVAERIPFRFFNQDLATGRQAADPRKLDAAFSSLEHLSVFAKQRGVTIALQNMANELGSPASLAQFVKDTHLHNLGFCFDIGHAHIEGGVDAGFQLLRDRVVTTHIHDNHGEKDEHLLPWEGTVDWDAALGAFASSSEPLPLVLELKETSPGSPGLNQFRAAFDRLEKHLEKKITSSSRSGSTDS
ncbi:MAG TPA: sugar phosphate isomerase/epimerase family protein [Candidatus Acidoferrales bacterium]|nr:sugar phosphate isomerase/epimerase family protein [Candidatus Acidoferrales bacterium]